jgi:DNA-binding NarL/FixJ family response regulator
MESLQHHDHASGRSPFPGEAPAPPRLAYFDRRPLIRDFISRWLAAGFPECAIDVFGTGLEAEKIGPEGTQHSLYIYHIGADRASSPPIAHDLRQLAERDPAAPLVVLAEGEEPQRIAEAFNLGAKGYIPTSLGAEVALRALRLVAAGGTYAPTTALRGPAPAAEATADASSQQRFTPRQTQILSCLRKGLPNKLIAHELGMPEATVKVHVRNIMKRIHAKNRTEVAILANQLLDGTALTSSRATVRACGPPPTVLCE